MVKVLSVDYFSLTQRPKSPSLSPGRGTLTNRVPKPFVSQAKN